MDVSVFTNELFICLGRSDISAQKGEEYQEKDEQGPHLFCSLLKTGFSFTWRLCAACFYRKLKPCTCFYKCGDNQPLTRGSLSLSLEVNNSFLQTEGAEGLRRDTITN